MTVREIQKHREEMQGDEISRSLISTASNEKIDEVKKWQARPLDPIVPIVYLASCFILCEPLLDSPNRYFFGFQRNLRALPIRKH